MGLFLVVLAFAGAIFVACPTPLQAWALVLALALGAGCLVFALTGVFELSIPLKSITSAGGAAVLVLFFAFTPGVMSQLRCEDFALRLRVCAERDCPAGAIAATVSILGDTTSELPMDGHGEGTYRYGAGRVGERVQIYAAADGFTRSAPLAHQLASTASTLIQIPLVREGQVASELLAPSVSTSGEWLPPRHIELGALRSLPVGSRVAFVEREGGDDLSTWGVAAFEAGDFELAAEILEAEQAKGATGDGQAGAPFLAAAYVKLGRSDAARVVVQQIEEGPATAPQAPPAAPRSVLTENAAQAARVLPPADASMVRDAAKAYRVRPDG